MVLRGLMETQWRSECPHRWSDRAFSRTSRRPFAAADAIIPVNMVAEQPILRLTSDELQEKGHEQVPDHPTGRPGCFVARGPRPERHDALHTGATQPLECRKGRGRSGKG